MSNNSITVTLILAVLVMLGVAGWLGYTVYQQKTETENAGQELFFASPEQTNSITWYSQIYLLSVKPVLEGSSINILDENGESVYKFDGNLYVGDKSEFGKNCESLKIETGKGVEDKIELTGINCE